MDVERLAKVVDSEIHSVDEDAGLVTAPLDAVWWLFDAAREVVDAPRMWWCGRYDIYSAEQSCNLDGLTAALHPDCGWVRIVKEDR